MKTTLKHHMSFVAVVCILLLTACTGTTSEKEQVTTADYENAAKHMDMNKYIYNTVSDASWSAENHLIYQKKDKRRI